MSNSAATPTISNNPMGYAPINSMLLKLGIPMMISMLVQALYNVVDSIFVSFVSEDALSAVVQIMASNSLDEYLVRDLLSQGAQIDSFGIGERLITSKSEPVFGGVYKLVAVEDEKGEIIPKIKVSENVEKITTPHFKQAYRFFDKLTGKALGDVLTLRDEVINEEQPYMLFHPIHTWKKKIVTDYVVKPLQVQLFDKGECVYECPPVEEVRQYCHDQIETLWEQIRRFENPQTYYVDYSTKLWRVKNALLEAVQ